MAVRLTYLAGLTTVGDVRPLTSPDESATLAVDLARAHTVGEARALDISPLGLLLGVADSDSPTRRLELAVWGVGLDWAWTTLGTKPKRKGATVLGQEAVDTVNVALGARRRDVDLIADAVGLFAYETSTDRIMARLDNLNRLRSGARREFAIAHTESGWVLTDEAVTDDLFLLAVEELGFRCTAGETPIRCGECDCLFFRHGRSDEAYCRRAAPGEPAGGRPCRQVGPQHRYADRLDPFTAAYRRNYKRLDQQARRGLISRARVDRWRSAAKALVKVARQQHWTPEQFEAQLDSIKKEH